MILPNPLLQILRRNASIIIAIEVLEGRPQLILTQMAVLTTDQELCIFDTAILVQVSGLHDLFYSITFILECSQ